MEKILIYENTLSCEEDIKDFILEGSAKISFPRNRMRMENQLNPLLGQEANYVLWCKEEFPSDIYIEWKFWPIKEPGLAMLFFAAKGINGEDLFDSSLSKRTGEYHFYHHGDINAFHVSYFRRKEKEEREFHICNLRKSYGLHMAAQGGDPIPNVEDGNPPYHLGILKKENKIKFFINNLEIFSYEDDGSTYGPLLGGGKIGFRQLAPFIGEYGDLKVYKV